MTEDPRTLPESAATADPSPEPDAAERLRALVIALAANPTHASSREKLETLLSYGPEARGMFGGIVDTFVEKGAIDRRAEVMLRAVANRIERSADLEDRTRFLSSLGQPVASRDDSTVFLSGGDRADGDGGGDGDEDAASRATLIRTQPPPSEGDVLDERYRIEELIGIGGMATVYRGTDSHTSVRVALKILKDEIARLPEGVEAFRREAERAASIRHPGVVRVLGTGESAGRPFMVMEFLDGQSLSRILRDSEGTTRPWTEVQDFLTGIGRALAAAHEAGIVHCDVKPSNIFQIRNGAWRILDFGVAQTIRTAATAGGSGNDADGQGEGEDQERSEDLAAVTPAYASRDLLEGSAPDPRDDIYALAVIAYEMATGAHPFDRLSANEAIERGLTPPRPADIPRRAWRVLSRSLSHDRADRPPTMAAFLSALNKRRIPWAASIAALVVAAVGTAAVLWPDKTLKGALELELATRAAVATMGRDQELVEIALRVKKGDGPLAPYILQAADPHLRDRLARLSKIEGTATAGRAREALKAIAWARTLGYDTKDTRTWSEKAFNTLSLDVSDRLFRADSLPIPILEQDLALLRKSDPGGYDAVEPMLINLLIDRLNRTEDGAKRKQVRDAARHLFAPDKPSESN